MLLNTWLRITMYVLIKVGPTYMQVGKFVIKEWHSTPCWARHDRRTNENLEHTIGISIHRLLASY